MTNTTTTTDLIEKTQEYLDYIKEHIANFKRAWTVMQNACQDEWFIYDDCMHEILNQEVNRHDMSKLSAQEFIQYRNYFYPISGHENGDNDGLRTAWAHHYQCNSHHWEHWLPEHTCASPDICDGIENGYIMMILDWTAMGFKFGGTALDYYHHMTLPSPEINSEFRAFQIHKDYEEFVLRILAKMHEFQKSILLEQHDDGTYSVVDMESILLKLRGALKTLENPTIRFDSTEWAYRHQVIDCLKNAVHWAEDSISYKPPEDKRVEVPE